MIRTDRSITSAAPGGSWGSRLRAWLPEGTQLPEPVWRQRHRGILTLLWIHLPAVFAFALYQGVGASHALFETSLIAGFAVMATVASAHRRLSTVFTAVGLLTCSAELVHLSGGVIEMHFHYFVMVSVITLYQDWYPFLVAIGYVVLQHGVAGVVAPESVYNHMAAVDHPWQWAGIHGLFILGMSASGIVSWRLNEALLADQQKSFDALRESEAESQHTLSLLAATLDSTADGILVVDDQGRITSFNQQFVDMWRIPNDVLDARDDDLALTFVLDQLEDPDGFAAKVKELYDHPDAESFDALLFKDGRVFERSSRPQRVDGAVVGRVWSFHDATERHRLENELAHQAFHDSLTSLANQALFRDRMDHAVARSSRTGGRLAVLFVDLDNFKHINDSLGHNCGDDLLVAATQRLQQCLRPADTAARVGGDEFAVLLEDIVDESEPRVVADRIISALAHPFTVGNNEVFITASIGIACDSPGTTGDQLLRNADLAMYTAKNSGKAHAEVFRTAMHTAALERLAVEADLRRAIERDELAIHYQPIVELASGRSVGVEALLRWTHSTRGAIGPLTFIPVAEETGLIHELGAWVLHRACTDIHELTANNDEPFTLSVNLSTRQLLAPGVADVVSDALATSGLDPSRLIVEITETSMMHDTEAAIRNLTELRRVGVRLAVDDFGTGYSSLSYLQRFPIDILKIDKSFVDTINQGPEESSLARAIVRLGQTLQLTTIAEGVETREQSERLSALGCKLAQGFYFARPMPLADLRQWRTPSAVSTPPTPALT